MSNCIIEVLSSLKYNCLRKRISSRLMAHEPSFSSKLSNLGRLHQSVCSDK